MQRSVPGPEPAIDTIFRMEYIRVTRMRKVPRAVQRVYLALWAHRGAPEARPPTDVLRMSDWAEWTGMSQDALRGARRWLRAADVLMESHTYVCQGCYAESGRSWRGQGCPACGESCAYHERVKVQLVGRLPGDELVARREERERTPAFSDTPAPAAPCPGVTFIAASGAVSPSAQLYDKKLRAWVPVVRVKLQGGSAGRVMPTIVPPAPAEAPIPSPAGVPAGAPPPALPATSPFASEASEATPAGVAPSPPEAVKPARILYVVPELGRLTASIALCRCAPPAHRHYGVRQHELTCERCGYGGGSAYPEGP